METPSVLLQTRQNNTFTYDCGYDDVSDADVVTLLGLCRKAVESLEIEVERRKIEPLSKPSTVVGECMQKMTKTLTIVKALQRLEDKAALLVQNAVDIMMTRPVKREPKLYRTFLIDVLRISDRGLVVLCSASLGKQRIITMNGEERLQLIQHLKAYQSSFKCPILETLAAAHQVPTYNELFSVPSLSLNTRKRTWEEGPGNIGQVASNSIDAACQTSDDCQAMFTTDYPASEFLRLDEAGAGIILEEARKSRHSLTITLPAPHANPPFMIIPHEICADIMRLHTG